MITDKNGNKLTEPILWCLIEAARRFNLGYDEKTWNDPFLGLGVPSTYKDTVRKGYMKASFGELDRVLNWYHLTEKGIDIVKSWHLTKDDFSGFDLKNDAFVKITG
jgi:hypothetical protein